MMMLKVSQMFATANQEKIKEKVLYYGIMSEQAKLTRGCCYSTHQGLYMEKEHADNTMARFIEGKEVGEGILKRC